MTTMTVCGWLADDLGQMHGTSVALPARQYDYNQGKVPVLISHRGDPIGEIVHLEYTGKKLHAVATVDFERADQDLLDEDVGGALWYWSHCTDYNDSRSMVQLVEASLTRSPGTVAADPVKLFVGEPERLARQFSPYWLVVNAAETIAKRGRGPLHIRGIPDPNAPGPRGPMRYTTNSEILAIR